MFLYEESRPRSGAAGMFHPWVFFVIINHSILFELLSELQYHAISSLVVSYHLL